MDEGKVCSHCERLISPANYDLHIVHCRRNLERCPRCGEMVARARSSEHFDEVHAPASCDMCEDELEKSEMTRHKLDRCRKREVICPYCEISTAAEDSNDHEYYCGSRTDICVYCNKYITFRERLGHDFMVHGFGNEKALGEASSSREEIVEVDRGSGRSQRQGSGIFGGRFFATAALGAAIVLASVYFGRNTPASKSARYREP